MSMGKSVADRLMQLLMANSENLNMATEVSGAIVDDASRKRFRHALAEIMSANSEAIDQRCARRDSDLCFRQAPRAADATVPLAGPSN